MWVWWFGLGLVVFFVAMNHVEVRLRKQHERLLDDERERELEGLHGRLVGRARRARRARVRGHRRGRGGRGEA